MSITAKIICDSAFSDKRITTFELEYPRFIHSEVMTHRVFSRNAASSRAIPIKTMIENIFKDTATPVEWGKNQAGMTAKELLSSEDTTEAIKVWNLARSDAVCRANLGVHKQIANRILEPFSHIKVVLTATNFDNFFELRTHKDAQPEFQVLAKLMKGQYDTSSPCILSFDEENPHWHLPYTYSHFDGNGSQTFTDTLGNSITTNEAIRISVSCCAQVSYRKNDTTLEKADVIFNKMFAAKPFHASPFEHQVMISNKYESGNFTGNSFSQLRKILEVEPEFLSQ
jgi:thymidylate synthase ThyX